MGMNNNGALNNPTTSAIKFGAFGGGEGFTETEASQFSLALKTMWEKCTLLKLPEIF
jgi:hypothetical protein